MGFRLVPLTMIGTNIGELVRRKMAIILRYFTEFGSFRGQLGYVKVVD